MAAYNGWEACCSPEEACVVVFATTRGQAKRLVAEEFCADFVDVRVNRSPEFDCFESEGHVPEVALFEAGWYLECSSCYRQTTKDNGGVVVRGLIYCEECGKCVSSLVCDALPD